MRKIIKYCISIVKSLIHLPYYYEKIQFILYELRNINYYLRYKNIEGDYASLNPSLQTSLSFNYQWDEIPFGTSLPDDTDFMNHIKNLICNITGLPADWFWEKNVCDLGCGTGRFTFGLLSLGAHVTAVDQSMHALERTKDLCNRFSERITIKEANILNWNGNDNFDLVFCFGVVHHTGNTYLAIINAAKKVKRGGKLFLMIYGVPAINTLSDYIKINSYEQLRWQLRNIEFDDKIKFLTKKFGPKDAHGWFDAISPRVNDLLTFEEIEELLIKLGFRNIKRTIENRNHHIIADKESDIV